MRLPHRLRPSRALGSVRNLWRGRARARPSAEHRLDLEVVNRAPILLEVRQQIAERIRLDNPMPSKKRLEQEINADMKRAVEPRHPLRARLRFLDRRVGRNLEEPRQIPAPASEVKVRDRMRALANDDELDPLEDCEHPEIEEASIEPRLRNALFDL